MRPYRTGAHDPLVLPALRDLLYQHQPVGTLDGRRLARALWALRYLSEMPSEWQVEEALEVLDVEREAA